VKKVLILIFWVVKNRRGNGILFVGNLNNLYSNTLHNEGIINTGGYIMVLEQGCFGSLTMESFSCA